MIRTFAHFFSFRFPHYLGSWNRLIQTWRNFECHVGQKKNTTFYVAWKNRRHFATPPTVSSRKMSEKRVQKFHIDDASLPRCGQCSWLVEANFTSGTTNQKHYPNPGSDASSVWNFCVVVTLRICRLFSQATSFPHSLQKPFNWCF